MLPVQCEILSSFAEKSHSHRHEFAGRYVPEREVQSLTLILQRMSFANRFGLEN